MGGTNLQRTQPETNGEYRYITESGPERLIGLTKKKKINLKFLNSEFTDSVQKYCCVSSMCQALFSAWKWQQWIKPKSKLHGVRDKVQNQSHRVPKGGKWGTETGERARRWSSNFKWDWPHWNIEIDLQHCHSLGSECSRLRKQWGRVWSELSEQGESRRGSQERERKVVTDVGSSGFYSEEMGTLWRASNMEVTGLTEDLKESVWLTRVAQWKQVSVASLTWPMTLHNLKKNPAPQKNGHRPYSIHTRIHTTTRG